MKPTALTVMAMMSVLVLTGTFVAAAGNYGYAQGVPILEIVEETEYWVAYESPTEHALSLAWSNGSLWMADFLEGDFYKVSETSGGLQIEKIVDVKGMVGSAFQARDLTWDGEALWSISVLVNIERRILRHGAMLYEEPRALLASELELREPALYYAILRAIADGHRGPTAIARAIGKPSASHVQRYLDVLVNGLQLIRRELPVGPEAPSPRQRGRWQFADHFFAFWFTFVYPHADMLERGAARTVLDHHVRPNWAGFVGHHAWEAACREHVWRLASQGALDFLPNQVGRWWSAHHEIDICPARPGQIPDHRRARQVRRARRVGGGAGSGLGGSGRRC
ncbi:MAG: ATP-binding protein [Anaerolineae bacterium]